MTPEKIKNKIKSNFDNYFKDKNYGNLKYEYESKKVEWLFGEEIFIHKLNGLFPKGYSDKENISLKFLTGNKVEQGAIVTFSIELNICEGTLAEKILNSKFNFIENDYIFRRYSSMLNNVKYFKNSKISFYKKDIEYIDEKIIELIENLECFFIKPQALIYNVDNNLMNYIDENHKLFSYPFLTKAIIYTFNNKEFKENDILKLGSNTFSDFKHRKNILKILLSNIDEFR